MAPQASSFLGNHSNKKASYRSLLWLWKSNETPARGRPTVFPLSQKKERVFFFPFIEILFGKEHKVNKFISLKGT
jgi:hypothetical protein